MDSKAIFKIDKLSSLSPDFRMTQRTLTSIQRNQREEKGHSIPFVAFFNSIISGTQFGAGLPRSAHAQSDV